MLYFIVPLGATWFGNKGPYKDELRKVTWQRRAQMEMTAIAVWHLQSKLC